MKTRKFIKIALLFACLLLSIPGHAEKKVALIIGNEIYPDDNYDNLRTCVNDANAINQVLKSLGYQTIVSTNCNQSEFANALLEFETSSKDADVAVYFFSGHAKNIGGELYLVPSNTEFKQVAQRAQFVSLSDIRDVMENNSKLSLLFIDACRDGARSSVKGITKGGNRKNPSGKIPTNSKAYGCMVCYATQNGEVATIGVGNLSPFTQALVAHLTDGDEFRTVWKNIKNHVTAIAPGQYPDEEDFYENSFYFNYSGPKSTVPETKTSSKPEKYKQIVILANVPNAKVNISGSIFDTGKAIRLRRDKTYTYTIDVEGYQHYSGIINVDQSPSTIFATLLKHQKADLYITSNKTAEVYLDQQFVGKVNPSSPLLVSTVSGNHTVKLTSNGYWDENCTLDLTPGRNSKSFTLTRHLRSFWDWDDYNSTKYFSYHFSPKYQIGLSYMYRPENCRWGFGAILASSTYFWNLVKSESYSYASVNQSVTYSKDVNGTPITYRENTVGTPLKNDNYSAEIDPFHEAEIKNRNLLILGNVSYNICNGIQIEAGIGAGYHKKDYKMSYVAIKETTTTTNVATGELVGEPKINYSKQDANLTYKGNSKWSPAARLGAKFFIPLDGWDSNFITIGGGYTFLFTNFKQSSWDFNIGYAWSF